MQALRTSRRFHCSGCLIDEVIQLFDVDAPSMFLGAPHKVYAHNFGEVPARVASQPIFLQLVPPNATLPLPLPAGDLVQVSSHHDHSVGETLGSGLQHQQILTIMVDIARFGT